MRLCYKDRAADRQRQQTVTGHEFVRRFLQHVLPAGFHKVRYYGLCMPRANCCATSGMFSCWRNPPGHRPNPHPSPMPTSRPRHRRAVARIARLAI